MPAESWWFQIKHQSFSCCRVKLLFKWRILKTWRSKNLASTHTRFVCVWRGGGGLFVFPLQICLASLGKTTLKHRKCLQKWQKKKNRASLQLSFPQATFLVSSGNRSTFFMTGLCSLTLQQTSLVSFTNVNPPPLAVSGHRFLALTFGSLLWFPKLVCGCFHVLVAAWDPPFLNLHLCLYFSPSCCFCLEKRE